MEGSASRGIRIQVGIRIIMMQEIKMRNDSVRLIPGDRLRDCYYSTIGFIGFIGSTNDYRVLEQGYVGQFKYLNLPKCG